MIIDNLISIFEARINGLNQELQIAIDSGDADAQNLINARIQAIRLCITDTKSESYRGTSRFGLTSLKDVCSFKKHKGLLWEKIIDLDPTYVDYCILKVDFFQLDESAHAYLLDVKKQKGIIKSVENI